MQVHHGNKLSGLVSLCYLLSVHSRNIILSKTVAAAECLLIVLWPTYGFDYVKEQLQDTAISLIRLQ